MFLKFYILTKVILLVSGLKVPSDNNKFPSKILNMFHDYDLILHFDDITENHIYFLSRKNPYQGVRLINYDIEIKDRPEGYKYMHIVLLEDPFIFQIYSSKPYNFYYYDFVIFVNKNNPEKQIWKMRGLNRAAAVFIYNIQTDDIFYSCYYCGNLTAVLRKTDLSKMRSLLNDYSDFNGHIFKIGYTNFPPFFWVDSKEKQPKGAEGELLQTFSKIHNFQYQLVLYQSTETKGAWQSLVEAVEASTIDWAVGGLSVSLKRGIYTDFTRYIKNQGFGILYAIYQDKWSPFERIFLVFQWPVWLAIITVITLICFIAKKPLKQKSTYSNFIKMTTLAIFEQALSMYEMKLIKFTSVRTLFFVWWLSSLSLTSVYKSKLASYLVIPKYNQPHKIDDLVAKDFQFVVNKVEWSVLRENLENSLDEVYSEVLSRIRNDSEFCPSVLALNGQKLALIDEESSMEYDVYKNCNLDSNYLSKLRLVSENIFPSSYHAWSMAMGTPFRLKFSKTIGKMDDYGLIAQWYKKASFYHIPRSNSRIENQENIPLTLSQIFPCFLVLGIDKCQMGGFLARFWARITEYPIKTKPVSFHLQKSFKTTGEEKTEKPKLLTDAYDELQNAFIRKLIEVGHKNCNWYQINFPLWDQMTIDNLNNVFMLLSSDRNGLDFKHSIGDSSLVLYREQKFNSSDANKDGLLNIDEFLILVYNFNAPDENGELKGVARMCLQTTELIRNVTYLSVGEQLHNGLF